MKCFPRFRAVIVTSLLVGLVTPQLYSQAAGSAEQAAEAARQLLDSGNYQKAAEAFEQVLKDYPTSTIVADTQYRLALAYYVIGEHDKALAIIPKLLQPPTPPSAIEMAYSLRPRITSGKAAKLASTDPKRRATYEEAIKQFDEYLSKYPKGDDVETARYGRALAAFSIEKYDDAVKTLRENIAAFGNSESIADSKYLLGLALYSQAIAQIYGDKPDAAAGNASLAEAEKVLTEIQKGPDIALGNDATFQLAEIASARAGGAPDADKAALYEKALALYRQIKPRETMVAAQEARIAGFTERSRQALAQNNVALVKKLASIKPREMEKLEMLKQKPDQSLAAILRIGKTYFMAQKYDEARVVLTHAEKFVKDTDQKREALFYRTLSYISQIPSRELKENETAQIALREKAVANYEAFQSQFPGDPIAENLPVAMGRVFVTGGLPEKALPYLDAAQKLYPKSRFLADIGLLRANAAMSLKRFDEALKAYDDVLKSNPAKEIAAGAELGKASVLAQTKKLDEAIAQFKKVRDTYPGTSQAEQAQYNIAGLTLQKGDAKGAIAEFDSFLKTYPSSTFVPDAAYLAAVSQELSGDKDGAVLKYAEVVQKYPDAKNTPDAYLRMANVYAGAKKYDEMERVIREFGAKYPESPRLFSAYRMIAQTKMAASDIPGAIAVYKEFVDKYPKNPSVADGWREYAESSRKYAEMQGNYSVLPDDKRKEVQSYVDNAVVGIETLLSVAPDSPQVAAGLKTLVSAQDMMVRAKVKTEADVEKYFQALAEKYAEKPGTKSKIIFSLASYIYPRDRVRATELMTEAYDASLVYAPADVDLYGTALLDQQKADEAEKVYTDLAADYPNPNGVAPEKAPAEVQQAQSIAMYGIGKALSLRGDTQGASAKFEELKRLYPWSPKIVEANLGIAQQLYADKQYDKAIELLVGIARAQNATVDVKGSSMLVLARCFEAKGDVKNAIDNYGRIATFFAAAIQPAAEGLYKAGQLIVQLQVPTLQKPEEKKSQMAKARGFLEKCTKDYSGTEWAPKAQQLLGQLPKE